MHNGFVCHATIEIKEGWEEVERKLLTVIVRRPGTWKSGGGTRDYWWYVDTISTARVMADAARAIPGVSAEAREPLEGE
jgi:hypothetical protein